MVRKATAQEMEILPTSPSATQPHYSTRAAAPGWKTYSRPSAAWDADAADSSGPLVQPHVLSAAI